MRLYSRTDDVNLAETLGEDEEHYDYNAPLMVFDDTGEALFMLFGYALYKMRIGARHEVQFGVDLARQINDGVDPESVRHGRRVRQLLYMKANAETRPQPLLLLFIESRPASLAEAPEERKQYLLHVNPMTGNVWRQPDSNILVPLDRSYLAVGIWGPHSDRMYGIRRNGAAVEFGKHTGKSAAGSDKLLSLGVRRMATRPSLRGLGVEYDHQRQAVLNANRPNAVPLAHAMIWLNGQHMPHEYFVPADALQARRERHQYVAKVTELDYGEWPLLRAEVSAEQFLVKPIRGMFTDPDNKLIVVTPNAVAVFGPPRLGPEPPVPGPPRRFVRHALFVLQYGVVYKWATSHRVHVLWPFVAAAFSPAKGGLLAIMTPLETMVIRMHDWEPVGLVTQQTELARSISGSHVTRNEALTLKLVASLEDKNVGTFAMAINEIFFEIVKYM
jgi:hypothetical protein